MAAPTAPAFTLSAVTSSGFKATITTASTDTDGDLLSTTLRYRAHGGEGAGAWTDEDFAATVAGTAITVSGLAAATSYLVLAFSTDAAGNLSVPGTAVTVTTSAAAGGSSAAVDSHAVPGALVWAPTDADVTGTYPYGGTAIGHCAMGIDLLPGIRVELLQSGEDGGVDPVDVIYMGGVCQLRATLQGWTATTLARAFPGGLTEAGTAGQKITWPGSLLAGQGLYYWAGKLLFCPDDGTEHYILARKAIGVLAEPARINLGERDPRALEVTFYLLADTSASDGEEAAWVAAKAADLVI